MFRHSSHILITGLFLKACFLFAPHTACAAKSYGSHPDSVYSINVCFLYGSKPKKKYRSSEPKAFGGIHGGHVTIQVEDADYGFEPAWGFHVFAHQRRFKADFVEKSLAGQPAYSPTSKTVTFIIPVTAEQQAKIKAVARTYCANTPYDYAFFGMRCAAATQDILGQAGLVKKRKRFFTVVTTFYPKRLRRRMFRLARHNHYQIIQTPGRDTRKWEKD